MKKLLWLLGWALLAAQAAPALAASGYIHGLTGTATVRSGSGEARALKIGDLIDPGQTIATGENSSAVLKFEDGQIAALSPRTSFTVQDYFYDKKNIGASRVAFNLLQGGLRFITGVIGATNRNAVNLRAGTATIGIRGTDVVIYMDAVTQAVTAAVNNGAVALNSQAGFAVVVLGQVATAVPGLTPAVVGVVANIASFLPAVASASIVNLNSATNIPLNTPVNVQLSAQAVALAALAQAQPGNLALQQQAAEALQAAVLAATEALQQAIAAGGNNPVVQPSLPQEPTGETSGTTSSTPGTGGTGGAGGGGAASPN
jgi:hypothetical protein